MDPVSEHPSSAKRENLQKGIQDEWDTVFDEITSGGTRILEVASAWEKVTRYIQLRSIHEVDPSRLSGPDDGCREAWTVFLDAGLPEELLDWLLDEILVKFPMLQRDFDESLRRWEISKDVSEMKAVLKRLAQWYQLWELPIRALISDTNILRSFRYNFQLHLFPHLTDSESFCTGIKPVLSLILSNPSSSLSADPDTSEILQCIHTIGLLSRFEPTLFKLVYELVDEHVRETCAMTWGEEGGQLRTVLDWAKDELGGRLARIYAMGMGSEDQAREYLKPALKKLDDHVHKTLCDLRISELFNIIVEFPESTPAIDDLKACLSVTDDRDLLVQSLRAANNRRLLQPGADTKDIISQYVSTIKSLRTLDPPGVLLSRVASPIRSYLRSREDTIRCIVSLLIGEDSDLAEEMTGGGEIFDGKEEPEDYSDINWVPDPVDAPPDYRKSKGSDIIQMLVSIYDTKDVFIKELQVLLAQRLLEIKDYDLERDKRTVEILKLRFGESSLQVCEVMLKDLADSKRSDQNVHHSETTGGGQPTPIHATIVSRNFWPAFPHAPLSLPGELGKIQRSYETAYCRLKPDKKLRWLPQLGSVEIEVELKDRTVSMEVTPLQAAIIELFQNTTTWNVARLTAALKVNDPSLVLNGLFFWVNQGVMKSLDASTFELLEEEEENAPMQVAHVMEEAAPAIQSVQNEQIEQMRVHWQFIRAMLTNLGQMPMDRIHGMLTNVLPGYSGRSVDELGAFLEVMEREGVVECTGGAGGGRTWKLVT